MNHPTPLPAVDADVAALKFLAEHIEHADSELVAISSGAAPCIRRILTALTAAQARAEAVEKDAERYRWLRASAWYVGPEHFYCDEAGGMQNLDDKNITADSLNAAIDSAIGGKGA